MRERCWNCKRWEEHFYWDHLPESSFHFMKVIDGDFSHRMELPPKFSKNFRVDLLDVVTLKTTAGKSWEIGLRKEQDHFYFQGGWEQFIEANKIELDHTLIFQYSGESSFTVKAFDQTGCLMAAPQVKQESENDNMPDLQTSHFVKTDGRAGPSGICKLELDDFNSDSISRKSTNLNNTHEIAQPQKLKLAGKQDSSSFVIRITKNHISTNPYITIPMDFWLKQIPSKPHGITICNQSGKKWFVICRHKRKSWGFSGKTLFNFVRENNIKMGDAYEFKLWKPEKKVMLKMCFVQA